VRILIVTQYFWPEEFRINDLALGLRERGHEVTVLTGKPNYPGGRYFPGYGFFRRARETFEGIAVIRVPLVPRGRGGGVRLAINYLSFAAIASLVAPFRVGGGFDAILVYEPSPVTVGLPALVLKAVKRAPVLFWVQDLWPESLEATGAVRARWALRMVERMVRFIYRGCDRILVQSRGFVEPVERCGASADRVRYFPNSAEPLYRPLEPHADVPERAALPQGFRVMFAGNIGAAQDFATILAAAGELASEPSIHWIVLGEGRMSDWVRAEVARRGLQSRVHLLGRHPVESMPRWFSCADAMLVTLRREPIFAYTIPTRIQSYLACARPIVAALDGEGARVIEESGAGIAVPAEDARALAEAVRSLARLTPQARERMGLAGRRYFEEHFERERLLSRLERWMRELDEEKVART